MTLDDFRMKYNPAQINELKGWLEDDDRPEPTGILLEIWLDFCRFVRDLR